MNKKSKITLSDIFFYAMDGLNATYVMMRIELDESINKDVMSISFDRTCKRFPYFQTKLHKLEYGFELIPNENKSILHEDSLSYVINAKENDGFLYRVSINKNILTFSYFHGLTDASGATNFIKVLLTDYYERLGERVEKAKDIFDINGEVDPEETLVPLDLIPEDVKEDVNYGGTFFHIPKKHEKEMFSYTFSVNAKDMMKYLSSFNGSPNSLVAIAMANAIYDIHNESLEKGIDIAFAINAKNVLHIRKSHWPFIETSIFHFDKKILNMDEELSYVCVRGKIIADLSDEKLMSALAGVRSVGDIFDYIKDEKARKLLCLKSTEQERSTASVSYVGKLDFGSINRHIKGLYTFCEACVPIIEINCIDDIFYFSISSHYDVKEYVEKIIEYLNKRDIKCGELKKVNFDMSKDKKDKPKFGFNFATLHLISGIASYKKKMH